MTIRFSARTTCSALFVLLAAATARTASAAPCGDLPSPVYITGSSAVQPLLAGLASALSNATPPITIIYQKGGSCVGVNAVVKAQPITGTGTYWPGTVSDAGAAISATCDLPAGGDAGAGQAVDIGASDVFATSCPNVAAADVTAASIGDFWGPNQVMTFVVPKNAQGQLNISAEAAYLTFGKASGAKVVAPWTSGTSLAIRNASSGTQTMLGKAIRLDAASWVGVDEASSQGVETAIKQANDTSTTPAQWLGILSTGEADRDRSFAKVLAFQPFGSACAFWPDTSLTSFDKKNVRAGLYPVFGPLHLLTKVDGTGAATGAVAKKIVEYFTGAQTPPAGEAQLIDLEIANYTVPQCAMTVSRTSEMGTLTSYKPAKACGCYFDAKVPGGSAPASCVACPAGTCADATKTCNYGYCEAK
jgi:ABC-type phosphate transport system substrate-binding protein